MPPVPTVVRASGIKPEFLAFGAVNALRIGERGYFVCAVITCLRNCHFPFYIVINANKKYRVSVIKMFNRQRGNY